MKFLAEIRKKKRLTQMELSAISGIASNSIARYERGEMTPSIETAQALARALNITVEELLNGSNDEQIKITLSYDWNKMKEAKMDMTGNEFTVCLGANGEIGLNGAMKFTGRETIDKFLAKVKEQVEIAFEAQVKRGVIQEA